MGCFVPLSISGGHISPPAVPPRHAVATCSRFLLTRALLMTSSHSKVRNSSRVFTASLPFCRTANLSDVACSHDVRGPPLIPYMFDHCGDDANARFVQYIDGIMHGLRHIHDEFPGAEVHDNTVILVPSAEFKAALLPRLRQVTHTLFPPPGISIVDAVEGAFPEPKKAYSDRSRIVFDTLEAFDGMERLFVFAVGLDSVRTTDGCCNMYRAITRAHMFVCVVQEHLKGGWPVNQFIDFRRESALENTLGYSDPTSALSGRQPTAICFC